MASSNIQDTDLLLINRGGADYQAQVSELPPAADTNLGINNRGIETLDVTSSTGTDVTIPAATDALAGLMTAADKATLEAGGTPNGGTGDRPSSPEIGDLYFDTDLDLLLVWNGTAWEPVSPPQDPGQWQRNGTKLTPINDGDTVAVTAADGTENITLNADGSATFAGDVTINDVTVGLGGGSLSSNTAVGKNALYFNTTGGYNIAIGNGALQTNTEGTHNTALGRSALYSNTKGTQNTAVGLGALYTNTTGNYNTTLGRDAGYFIEGSNNTILGAYQGTAADATLNDTVIISAGATERARCDSSGNWQFPSDIKLAGDIINTTVDGDQDIICDGSGLIEVTEYNLTPMEVVTKHDIGTAANEVPLNGFLGTLAYKNDLAIANGLAVADLPPSPIARVGNIARVTDGAASLTWGATVTGGGTAQYLVWYNGTNWTVFGA
jgi:hypothetical protein